jgi:hypothetical protein
MQHDAQEQQQQHGRGLAVLAGLLRRGRLSFCTVFDGECCWALLLS